MSGTFFCSIKRGVEPAPAWLRRTVDFIPDTQSCPPSAALMSTQTLLEALRHWHLKHGLTMYYKHYPEDNMASTDLSQDTSDREASALFAFSYT